MHIKNSAGTYFFGLLRVTHESFLEKKIVFQWRNSYPNILNYKTVIFQ